MSFLDRYLSNETLTELSSSVKSKLESIEVNLTELTQGEDKFDEIIKDYVPQIIDIVKRIKEEFSEWKISKIGSSFKFVLQIGAEVAGIVNALSNKIVPGGSDPSDAHAAKVQFGKELSYFVYCIWDPRLIKWIPIGLESWVEKKVIYWLSGMAVDNALKLIEKK